MPLPAVAALMPIPSAPPINAGQLPVRAMRNSKVQTLTRDDISARDLSIFIAADDYSKPNGTPAALDKLPGAKICGKAEEITALDRAMWGGNPEEKTLRDLAILLESLYKNAKKDGCNKLLLISDHGQISLMREFDGSVSTCAHVVNNHCEFKKEKYAGFNDELTLSVLRASYRESLVNDFLGVKHGTPLPVGALNNVISIPSASPINTAQSPVTAAQNLSVLTKTRRYKNNIPVLNLVSDWRRSKRDDTRMELATWPRENCQNSGLIKEWNRIVMEDYPEGKTLQDLTLILACLIGDAGDKGFNDLIISSVHGQITLEFEFDGSDELIPRINDECTLSVLRALYKESTVNDFLGIENDYLPSTTTKNSSVQMVTIDDMSARSSSTFIAADECVRPDITFATLNGLLAVEMNNSSALLDAWERAVVGGNPEGKTLQDLTLMLKLDLRDRVHGGHELALCNDRGQVKIGRRFWGGIKTYTHVANNNYNEFKKEKYARINDKLTLSILRVLFKESIVNNFLDVKNDYFPMRLVR